LLQTGGALYSAHHPNAIFAPPSPAGFLASRRYRCLTMKNTKSDAVVVPVIDAFSLEANIKRKLRKHFRHLGFEQKDGMLEPGEFDKERYRFLHREHREQKLEKSRDFLESHWDYFKGFFANGTSVNPSCIRPRLELVESDTWQNGLFRIATLTWSVPVSQGFGRRMRFLVWDDYNDKLIGIFALGDPVFNLGARDKEIGWSSDDRKERLVGLLDAFVLGAVPPYNGLLCGKLIACLIRSQEVVDAFKKKYGKTEGIISKKAKRAKLVAVTTTSSLGRSSIYNRLTLSGQNYFEQVGFTEGYGHFQVPDDIFADMRQLLELSGHRYARGHKYGDGPNWRLRTIRAALAQIGVSEEILKHNLKREIFLCRLADNTNDILRGNAVRPDYSSLKTIKQISKLCRSRWIRPRSERRPEFTEWKREWIREHLILGNSPEPRQQPVVEKCA
jgi:hypothetical protein